MTRTVKERPILFSGPMVKALLEGRKTQTRRIIRCGCNSIHINRLLGAWPLSRPPYQFDGSERPWQWKGNSPPKTGDWIEECQTDVDDHETYPVRFPYGQPGDRLFVKETWALVYPWYDHEAGYVDEVEVWSETIPPTPPDGLDGKSWRVWYAADSDDINQHADDRFVRRYRSPLFMPRWASRITLEITEVRVERLQSISYLDCRAEGIPAVSCYDDSPEPETILGAIRDEYREVWESINGKGSWDLNSWVWALSFRRLEEL